MNLTQLDLMFWVGIALVAVGVVFFALKAPGGSTNAIKVFNFEVAITHPALLVIGLGAALMWYSASQSRSVPKLEPAPSPVASAPVPAPSEPAPAPTPAPIVEPEPPPAVVEPQPAPTPDASRGFGVVLIASSMQRVAAQQAIKAKSIAPANAKIRIYQRGVAWAVVVHYSDSLRAETDLPKYNRERDWADAYVVNVSAWCPNAETLSAIPSSKGPIRAFDCVDVPSR